MQLQDFAQVVRSKNAGPRRFTLSQYVCCWHLADISTAELNATTPVEHQPITQGSLHALGK
jgi:hypothetical protein